MNQDCEILVHQFEIVNRGPGTTSKANVNIDIPISSGHGNLLVVKSIQVSVTNQGAGWSWLGGRTTGHDHDNSNDLVTTLTIKRSFLFAKLISVYAYLMNTQMQLESMEKQNVDCRHMPKSPDGSVCDLTLGTAERVHLVNDSSILIIWRPNNLLKFMFTIQWFIPIRTVTRPSAWPTPVCCPSLTSSSISTYMSTWT